jgi:hypothetical protein
VEPVLQLCHKLQCTCAMRLLVSSRLGVELTSSKLGFELGHMVAKPWGSSMTLPRMAL